MKTKTKNNLIEWSIFFIFAIPTTIVLNIIFPNFTPFNIVLFGALCGMIIMIVSIKLRKFINYIQNARRGSVTGELNILYKKPIYPISGNLNKSLLTKLAWRYLFKKIKDDKLFTKGRCINCDANGERNPDFECCEYYCPCNWNEQLKRKTKNV